MAAQWHDYKPSGDWFRPRHATTDILIDTTTLSLFMIHYNHSVEQKYKNSLETGFGVITFLTGFGAYKASKSN